MIWNELWELVRSMDFGNWTRFMGFADDWMELAKELGSRNIFEVNKMAVEWNMKSKLICGLEISKMAAGFELIWMKLWKGEKEAAALHFHIQ
jgi:hypothetical protein